ncbi:MAG: selenoneine synthase SenA [Myxococcota bacterium]
MGADPEVDELRAWLVDARERSLALISDLDDDELIGPRLAIVNPLLWEIGHVAWFHERWVLRFRGEPSLRADADRLWDSIAIAHDDRWELPLPPREETLAYARQVLERVLERLERERLDPDERSRVQLTVLHEDMHGEAFAYTRQTLGYSSPDWPPAGRDTTSIAAEVRGDVRVPGGSFELGARPGSGFVFDNEQWAHPVKLEDFWIARSPVTQTEFAEFVDDGGYTRHELWSEAGWAWREGAKVRLPLYWRRAAGGRFERRVFDHWVPLAATLPLLHVNAHEAEAYCRWAGRRLPSEAEWEAAASSAAEGDGGLSAEKRRFPWGDDPPGPEHARLDGVGGGPAAVSAAAAGDSAFGCRQMLGSVWEWTASAFGPYPGFAPGHYREYSEPWFRGHRVLRGGCWVTRARLLRNTWRNFYTPERRDVWAGFRTCRV